MKENTTTQDLPDDKTSQQHQAPGLTKQNGMAEKIIADVVALGEDAPLAGWDLLARDIANEEAERQRLVQEIPESRAKFINALAYWTSLSRRVDLLNRTNNLLIRMRAHPPLKTGGTTDFHEARTHD